MRLSVFLFTFSFKRLRIRRDFPIMFRAAKW